MYYCLNVVTEREGHASAVLLRAVEPVKNVAGRTQGPGLLCRAMALTRASMDTTCSAMTFIWLRRPTPNL